MLDSSKFVRNMIEKWIPGLGHLLQKAAFLAIFLGFLGYFINSLREEGIPEFTISPIPKKAIEKIAPTPQTP